VEEVDSVATAQV